MPGPAEASTSTSKRVEPQNVPLSIHGGGSIHAYVSSALAHLFSEARPAVVLTPSEAGNAATAISKIVSVAEVVKREYTKQLFTTESVKGKQRLPARLWQYNHLAQRQSPKDPAAGAAEDSDPAKEHEEAIGKLFEMQPGQKRPKKKHEPRLCITLSTRRVTGHPGSFQSPGEASERKRKQRRNRAERKSRQQDQHQQAQGSTETGQTHKRKRDEQS